MEQATGSPAEWELSKENIQPLKQGRKVPSFPTFSSLGMRRPLSSYRRRGKILRQSLGLIVGQTL